MRHHARRLIDGDDIIVFVQHCEIHTRTLPYRVPRCMIFVMPAYTLWILIFLVLPILVLFSVHFALLKHYFRIYLVALFGAFSVSVIWDALSFGKRIWYFPPSSTLGIHFFSIPFEEYVFLILMTILFTSLTIIFSSSRAKSL
jgi:lycopene cyclase domain-containing protein